MYIFFIFARQRFTGQRYAIENGQESERLWEFVLFCVLSAENVLPVSAPCNDENGDPQSTKPPFSKDLDFDLYIFCQFIVTMKEYSFIMVF